MGVRVALLAFLISACGRVGFELHCELVEEYPLAGVAGVQPSLAVHPDGYAITWSITQRIEVAGFDRALAAVGPRTEIGFGYEAYLAPSADGFALAWTDNTDALFARLDRRGVPVGPYVAFTPSPSTITNGPMIAPLGAGFGAQWMNWNSNQMTFASLTRDGALVGNTYDLYGTAADPDFGAMEWNGRELASVWMNYGGPFAVFSRVAADGTLINTTRIPSGYRPPGVTWDGTRWVVAVPRDGPGFDLLHYDGSGAVVRTDSVDAANIHNFLHLMWTGSRYAVFYKPNDRSLHLIFIDGDGTVSTPITIIDKPVLCGVAVARDGDGYAVAFSHPSAGCAPGDISLVRSCF